MSRGPMQSYRQVTRVISDNPYSKPSDGELMPRLTSVHEKHVVNKYVIQVQER